MSVSMPAVASNGPSTTPFPRRDDATRDREWLLVHDDGVVVADWDPSQATLLRDAELVAHDAKALHLPFAPTDDTMIAAYLIEPGRSAYLIDDLDSAVLLANTGTWTVNIFGSVFSVAADGLNLAAGGIATIKISADGAVMASRGSETRRLRALDVEVVNTLGAGDAFAAGFLAGLLLGDDPADVATATAARAVNGPTAR